jgi:DNA-binding NarL/FixJ family response regulator
LPKAVRAVATGGYWVARSVLSRFVESVLKDVHGRRPAGGPSRLSQREQQVLDSLLENLSNKEIASKLNISERTVKFHVSNLLAKFGVQRRADLIVLCFQQSASLPATKV